MAGIEIEIGGRDQIKVEEEEQLVCYKWCVLILAVVAVVAVYFYFAAVVINYTNL